MYVSVFVPKSDKYLRAECTAGRPRSLPCQKHVKETKGNALLLHAPAVDGPPQKQQQQALHLPLPRLPTVGEPGAGGGGGGWGSTQWQGSHATTEAMP